MKRSQLLWVLLGLFLLVSMAPLTRAQQGNDITGVWVVKDAPSGPWVFDLKQTGTTMAGRAWQSMNDAFVSDIVAGKLTANDFSFTLSHRGLGGAISFTGTRNDDSFVLTRTAENTGAQVQGLYSAGPVTTFTLTRLPAGSATPAPQSARTTTAPVTTNAAPAAARVNTVSALEGTQPFLATTGVAFAPWTFNLKIENGAVTGNVTQGNADPASGFTTTLVGPFDVVDGKADGNHINFKIQNSGKIAIFDGVRTGDVIAFQRRFQLLSGDPGRNGILGGSGATDFSAALNAVFVPTVVTPALSAAAPANTPAVAPRTGPGGRWQVTGVQNAPWVFEFTVNGTGLTGTIRQSGASNTAVSIAAGKIDGTTISFKVLSPDAERTITFRGRVSGNEISFTREIVVLAGGTRGGNDLFGGSAPLQFIANRVAAAAFADRPASGSDVLSYKGMTIDVSTLKSIANRDAIIDSLRAQIDIVDAAAMKPEQKAFLKSIPVSIGTAAGTDNGNYGRARGVELNAALFDKDKPVLLHELMHGYHDQKLPDGMSNAVIQMLFQQARSNNQFPSGVYMLSSVSEYFAMMTSVYLHGSAARDPFTRAAIKEKQPDCYQWLEQEFGAR